MHFFTGICVLSAHDGNASSPALCDAAKKHGVEILSSAEGGYLHNKIHHLGLKVRKSLALS